MVDIDERDLRAVVPAMSDDVEAHLLPRVLQRLQAEQPATNVHGSPPEAGRERPDVALRFRGTAHTLTESFRSCWSCYAVVSKWGSTVQQGASAEGVQPPHRWKAGDVVHPLLESRAPWESTVEPGAVTQAQPAAVAPLPPWPGEHDAAGPLRGAVRAIADEFSAPDRGLWCSVTLLWGSTMCTVASSDGRAAALDEMQYRFADGPCLASARRSTLVHVGDTRTSRQWSDFCAAIAHEGVRSVPAAPFETAGRLRASMNVYCDLPHAFDSTGILALCEQVRAASTALRPEVPPAEDDRTDATVPSRTTIERAVRVLEERQGCTADEALWLLVDASRRRGRPVRELAAELVAGGGQDLGAPVAGN